MEPFVKYPGGKSKETAIVNKYLPENVLRYFEPFVGGGAIYFNLNIKNSFINDKSKDLIDLYKKIKSSDNNLKKYLYLLDELWKQIETTPNELLFKDLGFDFDVYKKYYLQSLNKKTKKLSSFEQKGLVISEEDKIKTEITARKTSLYMILRDVYNKSLIGTTERIGSFYFLREYCYSSMFRFSKSGKFNVPYGGRSYDAKYLLNKLNYIYSDEMKNKLMNTTIEILDFEDFLSKKELNENDFVFLDPPYDSNFSTYDNNSFDQKEQIRLRDCMKNIRANWMLIIKKTDFIYDLYKEFNIYQYDMNYMVSFKNRNDKAVEHLLITNYKIKE